MKNLVKITIGIITILFSFQGIANNDSNNTLFTIDNKDKPVPEFTVDLEKKQIIFVDVEGTYMIDNDHIDVVMKGDVTQKNQILDISHLKHGVYLLEIEHKGYISTHEIVIE